ncbi:hypothetical protein [Acidocella aromatica]|uniref:Uncharacterized protein n=1 Tax=Acidocella aromatica TaxID=1303579 RepID=A0A840VW57_9PROT|nr:hypothetical protein [Acidocella aromatica]MBB5374362.1 hypothetical protein [Acidocella aromatica]
MKNVQIIDGATNATYSVFQATEEEYAAIFPNDQDLELIEDFFSRLGEEEAILILSPIWTRPILKRDAMGIHGTLFYNNELRRRHIPATKREVDWSDSGINQFQRDLFSRHR